MTTLETLKTTMEPEKDVSANTGDAALYTSILPKAYNALQCGGESPHRETTQGRLVKGKKRSNEVLRA